MDAVTSLFITRLPLVESASFCMKDQDLFISQRTGPTNHQPRSVGTRSVRTCARLTVHEPINIAPGRKYSHGYTLGKFRWIMSHGSRLAGHGLCKFCVRTVLMMINRGKQGNNHEKGGGLTFYIKNGGNPRFSGHLTILMDGLGTRLRPSFE